MADGPGAGQPLNQPAPRSSLVPVSLLLALASLSSAVRAAVCDGLRVVGALLHERKNNASSSAERDLSTMDSRVRILVIPTDEERAIARDVARLLDAKPAAS